MQPTSGSDSLRAVYLHSSAADGQRHVLEGYLVEAVSDKAVVAISEESAKILRSSGAGVSVPSGDGSTRKIYFVRVADKFVSVVKPSEETGIRIEPFGAPVTKRVICTAYYSLADEDTFDTGDDAFVRGGSIATSSSGASWAQIPTAATTAGPPSTGPSGDVMHFVQELLQAQKRFHADMSR